MRPPAAAVLAVAAAAALAVSLARPAPALADPPPGAPPASDPAAAQSLFNEARVLMQKGRFSEACPKLAQSQRIDPGGGTLLNLALCHEKEGKLASAWTEYEDSLSLARKTRRKDREQLASERIAALEPRLPRMSVEIAAPIPDGADVQVDGASIARAAWAVATPFDPGTHEVKVTAPGRATWSRAITLNEGETQHVPVLLETAPAPVLVDPCAPGAQVPGVSCGAAPAPAAAPAPSAPAARIFVGLPESAPRARHRTAGYYVVGGVGLAAIAASVVTGVVALNLRSSSRDKCPLADRGFCTDAAGIDDANNARTYAWVSTIALVGGLVAVTTALLLPQQYDEAKPASARR